jgi:hypothetical protein
MNKPKNNTMCRTIVRNLHISIGQILLPHGQITLVVFMIFFIVIKTMVTDVLENRIVSQLSRKFF